MIKLFVDIETLPGDEALKGEIASKIAPPGTMTKEETIKKWEESTKPVKVEEEYRNTALKAEFGKILCIGYIKETPQGESKDVIKGDEPEMLRQFWYIAEDVDLFIGHNILDFDLKFIIQRSIIHRVKPTRDLSFARYQSSPVYDTMHEWAMWGRDYAGLDTLAKVLGFESSKGKLGGDGSKVYEYYLEGRLQEICDYCMADVELTRKIYNRMNFIE